MNAAKAVFTVLLVASGIPALADSAPDGLRLVEQLGSDQFSERTTATRTLQRMGREAVPHLIEGLRRGDVETRHRCLFVLGELAGSDDVDDADAVFAALQALATDSDAALRSLVEQALADIRVERGEAALEQLRRLGATVNLQNFGAGDGVDVRIGAQWQGGERRITLLSRIEHLRALSIEDNRLGDAVLEHVAELSDLEWLYLGSSRITGKGLARLHTLSRLGHLSLRNPALTDDDFAQLPPLPELQSLGLDGTRLTNAGLKHLADYSEVRTLWLDRTQISSSGLRELIALPNLAVLYLSEAKVSGDGIAELHKLPQLRFASFKGCQLTPEDLERLSGLQNLDTLGLDHTNVGDEHLAKLNDLPKLRTLWLSKCPVTDAAVEHLQKFSTLHTLYLHGSEVSEHGAKALKKALPNCQVLR